MDSVNPETCLQSHDLHFATRRSEVKEMFEVSMEATFFPFDPVPMLSMFGPESRAFREVGTDLSYWSILHLRQKLS
jgi:hypothetical protein